MNVTLHNISIIFGWSKVQYTEFFTLHHASHHLWVCSETRLWAMTMNTRPASAALASQAYQKASLAWSRGYLSTSSTDSSCMSILHQTLVMKEITNREFRANCFGIWDLRAILSEPAGSGGFAARVARRRSIIYFASQSATAKHVLPFYFPSWA